MLGKLTSVEVVRVGLSMPELPRDLVQKTPSDGLTGRSDEENLGLSYQDIHRYIRLGSCGDAEADGRIRRREQANMHKRRMPLVLDPLGEGRRTGGALAFFGAFNPPTRAHLDLAELCAVATGRERVIFILEGRLYPGYPGQGLRLYGCAAPQHAAGGGRLPALDARGGLGAA